MARSGGGDDDNLGRLGFGGGAAAGPRDGSPRLIKPFGPGVLDGHGPVRSVRVFLNNSDMQKKKEKKY